MEKNNSPKWFNITITLLFITGFCFYLYLFFSETIIAAYKHNYIHLAIHDPLFLIITVLFSIVVPFLLSLCGWLSLKIKKQTVKITVCILCILALIMLFVPNLILLGFGGGLASYTESLDYYLVFDESVSNTLNKYLPNDFFPEKEVLNEYSEYNYFYEYGAIDENYIIELKRQIDDKNDYSLEQEHVRSMELVAFSENTYYINYTAQAIVESSMNQNFCECSTAVIHFNDSNQEIQYYVFRSETITKSLEHVQEIDNQ